MTFYISSPNVVMEARRKMMQRLFDDRCDSERVLTFPMNMSSNENEYILTAMLPGLSQEQVNIQFTEGTLSIDGEYSDPELEGQEIHFKELPIGHFSRSIEFKDAVEADRIEAELKNGILTVHIPKTEEAKPKTIKIATK
ncbi:MAG: Hsp20/alpha crystallin family protein [Chloroflexi bacterium]|nr:Hsp20/alpha crystallin family protein [Chloroflexota bacterium]